MQKYSFKNDYSEGCHESILKTMMESNLEQHEGYGHDYYSEKAKEFIRKKIRNKNSDIYFVSGGTQANLISISAVLKHHEAIIAVKTSHISLREAGAIEATGHMIINKQDENGKITVKKIQEALDIITMPDHMVRPKLVFISNSTEIGSIYTRKELEKISFFCKKNNLYLYLDGARLGSALASPNNDMTIEDISNLVDMFYIGGTKNGALLGEAIVINNNKMKEDFRFHLKQKGALLAKGRLLGIQFYELFKENLFFELAEHINNMAMKLANGIKEKGYKFMLEPESNQIFPILSNELIKKLEKKFIFYIWEKGDKESVVRLVTSWATREDKVDEFLNEL
ncbi:MAG: aminotransferase class I/II-fold pyridoxal phosphate-dependent enzyme [Candidatus Gracilibacteria bacterium]|nr:aminotransferase class I/II-fold pyridoxal phosphate-dependent enzyme [Candidatus Gracilibacteria bacterium]